MTEWKPQPGKPAMTRDEKTLVTDLVEVIGAEFPLRSKEHSLSWFSNGRYDYGDSFKEFDLIEPTTAILAAHGIDADGRPVARGAEAAQGQLGADALSAYSSSAPFQPTRVDDRWFEAAKDFTSAIITREGTKLKSDVDPSFDTGRAARYADALMAEVAKREGR